MLLSSFSTPAPTLQSSGPLTGLVRFLKSHPLLFLILLTPGIPEYLSASSQFTLLAQGFLNLNPFAFILFFGLLAANIGLYGSGVVIIREAMIRWKKGWASVFLMGVAYGIVEEGIALWTLFNPNAQPVGNLGVYGHWLGVNWVWTMGLLIFHSVYSIGLPIFLFGLVFPDLKSKSLVSGSGVTLAIIGLSVDCFDLFAVESRSFPGYNPGAALLLLSGVVITVLVVTARKLPGDFLKSNLRQPKGGPIKFALLGALLFPTTLFISALAASANIPPVIPFMLDLVFAMFILTRAYGSMGRIRNQEQKVALGIGLIFPIAVFGIIASIGIRNLLIFLPDAFFLLFSRRLWNKWHLWTLMQRPPVKTTLPFGSPPKPAFP